MSDENKNPQNLPIETPSTNLIDQKSSSLNSKKIILIIFSIVLFIIASVTLYALFNRSSTLPFFPPKFTPTFTPKTASENKLPVNLTETPKPTLIPFPPKGDYVENQLIVEYKEGMSPEDLTDNDQRSQLAKALQDAGVVSQKKHFESNDPKLKNFYILTFKEGIDVREVSNKIYVIPQIKGVEPNGRAEIFK